MDKNQVPPNWENLVESSREDVTAEQYDLANTWIASTLEQKAEHHQSAQDNIGDTANGSSSLIATNNASDTEEGAISSSHLIAPSSQADTEEIAMREDEPFAVSPILSCAD